MKGISIPLPGTHVRSDALLRFPSGLAISELSTPTSFDELLQPKHPECVQ